MLNTFKLKNGITVATYSLPDLRSIHLEVICKGGSIVENKKNNGVAHFMEHLLVQGIPSLPNVEEFSSFIESLAGSYGAYTSSLTIGFHINLPAPNILDAVRISSEVFFSPLFPESTLEKERHVIIDEINQKMDSHFFKITQFFSRTRFGKNHPLTLNSAGTLEVVKKLTREELVEYWQRYFFPENIQIVVTGKFNLKELKDYLEEYFGKYQQKGSFSYPKISNQDFSKKGVFLRHDKNLSSNYLDLAFPSLDLSAPLEDRVKQNLALVILGGLRNSRLFKLLRYQKGLVYHISSQPAVLPGLGYIYITSEVLTENLEEVVTQIYNSLLGFMKNGPTEAELDLVKNYLGSQWLMSFDHPSAISSWLENDLLWNKKVLLPEDYIKIIKDVTVKDIIQLMEKYWDLSKLILTIQGPISNTKENVSKFEKLLY